MNFFGSIYQWFSSLYGSDLNMYLWGYNYVEEAYSGSQLYAQIGFVSLAVSVVWVVLYYFPLQHPRYSKWWSWLIWMGLHSLTSFLIGWGWTRSKLTNGYMELAGYESITTSDCAGFGLANIIICLVWFLLLSFCLKWFSRDAKYVPF